MCKQAADQRAFLAEPCVCTLAWPVLILNLIHRFFLSPSVSVHVNMCMFHWQTSSSSSW